MTDNAQELDILNLRTTNLNIRISPILKSKIIEQGARMGVNLSDYIYHLLTKAMTSQVSVEDTPQYRALEKSHKALKLELDNYKYALRPFAQKFANEAMPLADGGTVRLDNDLEALQYILNTFKLS